MMEFLSGFTGCWWPSSTCSINWSAWAAVTSAIAVMVALFVGVAPVVHTIRNGQMRARVVGRIFLAEVDLVAFWIAVGYQVATHGPHEAQHYNSGIGFALRCRDVDAKMILGEIEHVPAAVANAVASFETRSLEFQRTVCGTDGNPLIAPDEFRMVPTGWQEITPLYNATMDLRQRLHSWLSKEPPADLPALARRTSDRIHAMLAGQLEE